jgi:hypothetical protein
MTETLMSSIYSLYRLRVIFDSVFCSISTGNRTRRRMQHRKKTDDGVRQMRMENDYQTPKIVQSTH